MMQISDQELQTLREKRQQVERARLDAQRAQQRLQAAQTELTSFCLDLCESYEVDFRGVTINGNTGEITVKDESPSPSTNGRAQ